MTVGIQPGGDAGRLDEEPLALLERFHGHLGPFVVLGYRMGRFARKALEANPFELQADVFTGPTPPVSCLVDGIQVGSGCTLGKGNVRVHDGGRAEALFTSKNGHRLRLRARDSVINRIESGMDENNVVEFSRRIHLEQDGDLFEVMEG